MSKTTNKAQLELLLKTMQQHKEIAVGFSTKSRENSDELRKFWTELEVDLNAAGPPEKNSSEWKKVWCDQKKYVRKKVVEMEGQPHRERMLSTYEKAVYDLITMKNVDVVPVKRSFGLPTKKEYENENSEPAEPRAVNVKPKAAVTRPLSPSSSDELGFPEPEPEDILVKEIVPETVYKALERMHELKKQKLDEMKRHNRVMEDLRRREVESRIQKTHRLLEIEEMKLKLQAAGECFTAALQI